jgi:branched-chain amino acid transport system substrate-binding protein
LALSSRTLGTQAPEVLIKDDRNDPDQCLSAVQELNAAGCSIVILGTPSQAATKALPWAVEHSMLVLSPTVSASIRGTESDYYLYINAGSSEYGKVLATLAYQGHGEKRMATVGDGANGSYVDSVLSAFNGAYTNLGGEVSYAELFDSREGKPFSNLPEALRKAGSDGLLIVAASSDTVKIAKELERANLDLQIFLTPWPLTPDLIQNGGKAVEGVLGVSIADLGFQSPSGKRFAQKYQGVYGEEPSFTAMFGYETASILAQVLSRPGDRSALGIRKSIIAQGTFQGVQGDITFDRAGKAQRNILVFTIQNGAFKEVP